MSLDKIRNALKSHARHVEGAFSCDGIEIRLTFELGIVKRREPLESRQVEIGRWPELSPLKKHVFGEEHPWKLGLTSEFGPIKTGVVSEGGMAEIGVANKGDAEEPSFAEEYEAIEARAARINSN